MFQFTVLSDVHAVELLRNLRLPAILFTLLVESMACKPYELPSKSTKHLRSCYCYGYRFWGPIAFQGFVEISIFEIQYEAKIHSQTGSEMDRAVVLSVSGASATLHVPFIFLSRSFHFPFMFLSLVLMSIHFPFIFLSFSFQCAFMSSHLPFICTHVPFILHSCPFISFLQLWKWLDGLARELSATNGSR